MELGWNYMKCHPNATHNSTLPNVLNIKHIYCPRWKGGITNDKIYFSEKVQEKVLTTVKKMHNKGLSVVGCGSLVVGCGV